MLRYEDSDGTWFCEDSEDRVEKSGGSLFRRDGGDRTVGGCCSDAPRRADWRLRPPPTELAEKNPSNSEEKSTLAMNSKNAWNWAKSSAEKLPKSKPPVVGLFVGLLVGLWVGRGVGNG